MSIFNNPDFFPTPSEVAHKLCQKVSIQNKVILEPSMGKGDLVDIVKTYFPSQVIGCESSEDLLKISSSKVDRVFSNDFLKVTKEEISHINCIIANPPFSCADKHILHMWEIAPEGCEIVCLCNYETISNSYTKNRSQLKTIIKDYGYTENLGECFSNAERKTDVNVGLVYLIKPIVSEENYDMYFDMSEEEESQGDGIMRYNEVRNIVNRYVGALKQFQTVTDVQNRMNELIKPLVTSEHNISFKAVDKHNYVITFDTFKSELQKSSWLTVFRKLDAEKYMTASLKSFLNKFVEQQKNVPFTMSNIYKMIEMVVGTHGDRMSKVIVEVFDRITAHHSENRLVQEGWKTNSEYVVNKKFILPAWGLFEMNYSGKCRASYSGGQYFMDDLTKALCYITGTPYDIKGDKDLKIEPKYTNWWTACSDWNWGQWYDFNFVRVKVFKKRTIHCEFKDEKVWELFNREAAKAKGFQLASKFTGNYRAKTSGVEVYER